MKSQGLSRLPTREVERLLKAVHREILEFPITRSNLIACAFGNIEEHLDLLVGLDQMPAQRILVAVLAERRPRSAS